MRGCAPVGYGLAAGWLRRFYRWQQSRRAQGAACKRSSKLRWMIATRERLLSVSAMDRFSKSEPTPEAFAGLLAIPADRPVATVTLVRIRRDQPRARLVAAVREWRAIISGILEDYGCHEPVYGRVVGTIVGPENYWDHLVVTHYPSRRALMQSAMDERIIDAIDVRRAFIEETLSLVVDGADPAASVPPPLSIVPAVQPGPVADDPLEPAVAHASTIKGKDPLFVVGITRFRTDVPREQAEGAYHRWRASLRLVAEDIGAMSFPLSARVHQVYVGAAGAWDLVNITRYGDTDSYRRSLEHPALLSGRQMRALALEDSLLMVVRDHTRAKAAS